MWIEYINHDNGGILRSENVYHVPRIGEQVILEWMTGSTKRTTVTYDVMKVISKHYIPNNNSQRIIVVLKPTDG